MWENRRDDGHECGSRQEGPGIGKAHWSASGWTARVAMSALALFLWCGAAEAGGAVAPGGAAEAGGAVAPGEAGEHDGENGAVPVDAAAYGYKNATVAMEASYGFDNMAKGGRYLPVYVTLTNLQMQTFYGRVTVKAMESDHDIYSYGYPVVLEGGSTIQMNLDIPLGLLSDQLYVQLYDGEDGLVVKKRLKIDMRQDTPELLIGTLSDSQDKLDHLNGVGIHYGALQTRTCAMVAGSIPRQAAGLDQLDVLLITDYDIRRLTSQQIDAIKEWVGRGGVLLLGTGSKGQEAVETFLEGHLERPPQESEEMVLDMGEEFAIYGPSDVHIPLEAVRVDVKEGNMVLSSHGFPVLTAVNQKKGMVAVAAYDFCDIRSFCQEHAYVDKLFTDLLGEERIGELSGYLYDGGNSLYWAVQSMIGPGSVDKLPKISLYAVAIFSYILLAGPGLYFFLKQRELGIHYGPFVVLLSVCFSGMIYLMSSRTRFEDTFFGYASVREYGVESIEETTYVNMQTPYNKPYTVALEPSYAIRPLTRSAVWEETRTPQFTGEEKEKISIYHGQDLTRLAVRDVEAFSANYFRLEKSEENTAGAGITGDVIFFDGKFKGSVTNGLGIELEAGAVISSNAMVLIDQLKAGETVLLDDLPVLYYPLVSYFPMADRISGGYRFEKADIRSKDYMESLKRTNLLECYMDHALTGYQWGARVVAFSAEGEEVGFLLDKGHEVEGLTMYTALLDADNRDGERVYRTSLQNPPKVISGICSVAQNTMDGLLPLTLEYPLGQDITVEKLTFVPISEGFSEEPKYGGLLAFGGDVYFYNYDTGNFDKIDSGQREYIDWQLEPYLSPENKITVKYAYDAPQEQISDRILPVIAIVGRKEDAHDNGS